MGVLRDIVPLLECPGRPCRSRTISKLWEADDGVGSSGSACCAGPCGGLRGSRILQAYGCTAQGQGGQSPVGDKAQEEKVISVKRTVSHVGKSPQEINERCV